MGKLRKFLSILHLFFTEHFLCIWATNPFWKNNSMHIIMLFIFVVQYTNLVDLFPRKWARRGIQREMRTFDFRVLPDKVRTARKIGWCIIQSTLLASSPCQDDPCKWENRAVSDFLYLLYMLSVKTHKSFLKFHNVAYTSVVLKTLTKDISKTKTLGTLLERSKNKRRCCKFEQWNLEWDHREKFEIACQISELCYYCQ